MKSSDIFHYLLLLLLLKSQQECRICNQVIRVLHIKRIWRYLNTSLRAAIIAQNVRSTEILSTIYKQNNILLYCMYVLKGGTLTCSRIMHESFSWWKRPITFVCPNFMIAFSYKTRSQSDTIYLTDGKVFMRFLDQHVRNSLPRNPMNNNYRNFMQISNRWRSICCHLVRKRLLTKHDIDFR